MLRERRVLVGNVGGTMNLDKLPKLPLTKKQREAATSSSLWELIAVMICCLIPMFLMASEIDKDEWAKSGTGVILGGAFATVLGVYKIWKAGESKEGDDG